MPNGDGARHYSAADWRLGEANREETSLVSAALVHDLEYRLEAAASRQRATSSSAGELVRIGDGRGQGGAP